MLPLKNNSTQRAKRRFSLTTVEIVRIWEKIAAITLYTCLISYEKVCFSHDNAETALF